jgi:UDP-glucose 4-epimerase
MNEKTSNIRKHIIGILGGSGFVGFSLAKHLSSTFDIKILDVREPEDKSLAFEFCDVRDYEQVKKALTDVDLVIHTAIIQIPLINENKRLAYEVNFIGTHNVCKAVDELPNVRGMILTSSWHTIGERGLEGVIDEEFGYRPDKVENRARLYVLSKIAQETMVRYYDGMSDKIYGIIRMGTVLGESMPEKTAANIFIENGLKGKPLTPFMHSMHRPMLYVDINDICYAFEVYAKKILEGEMKKGNSLDHIINVHYHEPITILELAEIVKNAIAKLTNGNIVPRIEIVDQGIEPLFQENNKLRFRADISKSLKLLGINKLTHPREAIERIIRCRLQFSR